MDLANRFPEGTLPQFNAPADASCATGLSWVKDRTVPTIIFGVLYCCFVISCGRRRILHRNITKHPDSPVGRATAARIVPV